MTGNIMPPKPAGTSENTAPGLMLAPLTQWKTGGDTKLLANIDYLILAPEVPDLEGFEVESVNWSARETNPYQRMIKIREMLDAGLLPPLANGFQFVIDRRPPGEEHSLIPPREYTAYFSQRKVPIADADHKERDHDIGHIPSFQDMFGCPGFAQLVQQAAANSLDDEVLCKKFTGAMDRFGDEMRNLSDSFFNYGRFGGSLRITFVHSARSNLRKLAELALPPGTGADNAYHERQQLFDSLWLALGLAGHEAQADREEARWAAHSSPEKQTGYYIFADEGEQDPDPTYLIKPEAIQLIMKNLGVAKAC